MDSTQYRPEIDGLRALAVVAVVIFHMRLGLPGGFVGVDVFFVLSGFLITGILRRGIEDETFSLAEFWERRIRRIFPALFVVLLATLAVGYWLLLPNELDQLGKSSVAQNLLLANVYFARDIGYFAKPAEFMPLLHTWSLAVEEQFYLFFPLGLWFLRRFIRKKLFASLAILALLSFAGSVYGTMYHPGETFFLLPPRAWELLVGCLLAVLPWHCQSSPRRDSAIATLGLLGIVLPTFLYDSQTPFPGLAAAPPVLGTAAILFATASSPGIWLRNILSLKPVVFIGLISYSLYLWHWPAIVYARMYFGEFHWWQAFVASVSSFSLAVLSWKFIETPFRRNTYLKNRLGLFASTFILNGSALGIGLLLILSNGAAWRFPLYSPELALDVVWSGNEFITHFPVDRKLSASDMKTIGETSSTSPEEIDFVVWGDSHGLTLSICLNEIATENKLHGKAVLFPDFAPLPYLYRTNIEPSGRIEAKRQIMEFLESSRPRNLILIARWSRYAGEVDVDLRPVRVIDSRSGFPSDEDSITVLSRNFHDLSDFCASRGITLWIVKQIPETGEMAPASNFLRFAVGRSKTLSDQRKSRKEYQSQSAKIESVFNTLSSAVRFVDPAPLLFNS